MKEAAVTDVLFGINSVESRLLAGKQGVHTLTVREGSLSRRVEALVELAESAAIPVQRATDRELDGSMDDCPARLVMLRARNSRSTLCPTRGLPETLGCSLDHLSGRCNLG
jgi:tRNA G18 (ribose-2'-O)-methylase SpoU